MIEDDDIRHLYQDELHKSLEKLERNSSTLERWEACTLEMRQRYNFLFAEDATDLMEDEVTMIENIRLFERLYPRLNGK